MFCLYITIDEDRKSVNNTAICDQWKQAWSNGAWYKYHFENFSNFLILSQLSSDFYFLVWRKSYKVSLRAKNQLNNQSFNGKIWKIWICKSECVMVPKDFKPNQKISTNKTIQIVILSIPIAQKTWKDIWKKLFLRILSIL